MSTLTPTFSYLPGRTEDAVKIRWKGLMSNSAKKKSLEDAQVLLQEWTLTKSLHIPIGQDLPLSYPVGNILACPTTPVLAPDSLFHEALLPPELYDPWIPIPEPTDVMSSPVQQALFGESDVMLPQWVDFPLSTAHLSEDPNSLVVPSPVATTAELEDLISLGQVDPLSFQPSLTNSSV